MAGIAGIARSGKSRQVNRMLDKIAHRGPTGRVILEADGATLGIVWPESQATSLTNLKPQNLVCDDAGDGHFARAQAVDGRLVLRRDPLGVAPLYHGYTNDGLLCFASEVKAMLEVTHDVHEFPPGHRYAGENLEPYFRNTAKVTLLT